MAGPGRRAPQRLILDSGAVIALSRRSQRARAFVDRALELGAEVEVPVVVVAETLRGSRRDAPVHRVLNAVGDVPDATERHDRTAGRLLGTAGLSSTVDALVVAHAVEAGGSQILTGDLDDLRRLAAPHPEASVRPLLGSVRGCSATANATPTSLVASSALLVASERSESRLGDGYRFAHAGSVYPSG